PPTTDIYTLSLHDALPISCGEEYKQYYRMLKYDAFVEYQQKQWQKFDNTYNVNCLQRLLDKGAETFELEYVLKEHHYTLYYYDRDRKSTRLNSSHVKISYA